MKALGLSTSDYAKTVMVEDEPKDSSADGQDEKSLMRFYIEKPVGIGLSIGIVTGALNSIMLGTPMLASMLIGSGLGLCVCVFLCPEMRTRMKQRRERTRQAIDSRRRVRASSAFSTFD